MGTRQTLIFLPLILSLSLLTCRQHSESETSTQNLTDRERDGLLGPVKAVLTDDVVLFEQKGQLFETQQASSVSFYDESGKRILQTPFRVNLPGGYATTAHDLLFDPRARNKEITEPISNNGGKWVKVYDEKGNAVERIRYDADGKLIEKGTISYEFDTRGNWIKRTLSKTGDRSAPTVSQPIEVSNRHIIYLDSSAKSSGVNPAKLLPEGAKQLKSPLPANEATISSGRSLFNQKCISCHGENGKAQTEFASVMNVKPEDLTSPNVRALTEGEIFSVIGSGSGSSGMPAFKGRISDEALWQIALYVKQLSTSQATGSQTDITASSPSTSSRPSAPAPVVVERRYQLKGKVVLVEPQLKQVTIEHEEIQGYMGAMTMPFPLKDEKMLEKLKKDDRIQATLIVDSNGWRLVNVVIK
ncbi:MAG: c-type cytochrome [Acidobacteria bacterium]|nr:c-type cytochrome [Acidobacteriota bacterium]